MINDKILIGNKLLPNNDRRHIFASEFGNNIHEVDSYGASLIHSSATSWHFYSCPKSEIVYLPPGLHIIEVVARTASQLVQITNGMLEIELIKYQPYSNINLQFPRAI